MDIKKRVRILFISAGSRVAPATRYRIYQILPFLEKEGIDYKVYSIFSERMTFRMIKSPTFNKLQRIVYYVQLVMERFIRAWKIIFLAGRFDIVFLQRATFPIGLEKLLRLRNKNIIFDIDDAIYLPDNDETGFIGWLKRQMKKREVISVLKISKCVITENSYIKDFVKNYCKKVYIIVGPIDIIRNFIKEDNAVSEEILIGWIGSPSTAMYLNMLDGPIKELTKKHKIRFRLIGSGSYSIDGVKVELMDWDEGTEVSELHKFDIGIMPMPDNEWTRGKVGCKTVQYMANAIPSVVSYTPTTLEVINDGVNGFLADSEEEWIEKLSLLIENPELRKRIGIAGRKTAEQRFSIQTNGPRYIGIFKDCLNINNKEVS